MNYSSDICCFIVRQLSDDNATYVGRISNNRRTNNSLQGKTCAWAKDQGKTLYDVLMEIYVEYGFSKETTV
ncbi:hypothetical protein QM006_00025, partial [Bacteroides uniformis]|uniref:hypothetical protein n=1 Tax=Bacteroides uniformis TaxID=820 RepID=UPI00406C1CF7